jgi:hypothetical protein
MVNAASTLVGLAAPSTATCIVVIYYYVVSPLQRTAPQFPPGVSHTFHSSNSKLSCVSLLGSDNNLPTISFRSDYPNETTTRALV